MWTLYGASKAIKVRTVLLPVFSIVSFLSLRSWLMFLNADFEYVYVEIQRPLPYPYPALEYLMEKVQAVKSFSDRWNDFPVPI
ncbi:hypothetical protein DY000_02016034 [Brassica cretica]|uniref:Uncharacterized protein n=1 Tax=Brassica cretica TaxID=69181 RepID=A0ABQ7D3F6_BRACR|nr:hypothetical protein DY000_02016034 [Brassica cretica]